MFALHQNNVIIRNRQLDRWLHSIQLHRVVESMTLHAYNNRSLGTFVDLHTKQHRPNDAFAPPHTPVFYRLLANASPNRWWLIVQPNRNYFGKK